MTTQSVAIRRARLRELERKIRQDPVRLPRRHYKIKRKVSLPGGRSVTICCRTEEEFEEGLAMQKALFEMRDRGTLFRPGRY
jgi:hypothetical protein